MLPDPRQGFRLGRWTVEPLLGSISGQDGDTQHVEPKVMDVLVLLAARPQQLLTRNEIIEAVWARHVSADQLLTRAISELRRLLQDDRSDSTFIETVPKRGYRLLCDVQPIERAVGDTPASISQKSRGISRRYLPIAVAVVLLFGIFYPVYLYLSSGEGEREIPAPAVSAEATAPDTPWSLDASAPSIAVLPFVNMSDDPANEYLAEGLAEEIRNLLAGIPGVQVIGRTSSSAFTDSDQNLRVIGNALGVRTVLEGSVRQSGDDLRITAQLINTADASRIWSETYQRKLTGIFDVQDDVAAAIIDSLNLHIVSYPARGQPTTVPEAYALYLKARRALNIQDTATAEAELREVTRLDPGFAEAFELLAQVYWTLDDREGTKVAAAAALRIDPRRGLARALFVEANVEEYSFADVLEADIEAAKMYPNDPLMLRTLSWNLMISGYLREALAVSKRLVAIEPLAQIAHIRLAATQSALGNKVDSMAALKVAHGLGPSDVSLLDWYRGEAELLAGQDDKAIASFEAAVMQVSTGGAGWVSELVLAAREPSNGLANMDRKIPEILEAMTAEEAARWREEIEQFYLLFGYVDRYLDITLEYQNELGMWSPATYYVWTGMLHRELGFTANPKYIELAEAMGFIDLWERRGAPDYCVNDNSQWVCH